jgi:hypothetical protein
MKAGRSPRGLRPLGDVGCEKMDPLEKESLELNVRVALFTIVPRWIVVALLEWHPWDLAAESSSTLS